MSKFENEWYMSNDFIIFSDEIFFKFKLYAVYAVARIRKSILISFVVDLTEEQREVLNKINGINVYFGTEYGGKPNGNDENEKRIQ